MAARDRGARGRSEYGKTERERGGERRERERESGRSQELQEAAERTAAENRATAERNRQTQATAERNRQTQATTEQAAANDVATGKRRAAAQYGAYSTPGPIGGASSYGLEANSPDFGKISEPHQPDSPDRFESWARDVLSRNMSGQAPTPSERERLDEGYSGYANRQAAETLGSVASLGNPAIGLGVRAVEAGYSQLQSPEYQAGRAIAAGDSPITDAVGGLAGAFGFGGPVAKVASTLGGALEGQADPRAGLFQEVGNFLGRGKQRVKNTFGGNNDRQTSSVNGMMPSPAQTNVPAQQGFQFADPFNYDFQFTSGQ